MTIILDAVGKNLGIPTESFAGVRRVNQHSYIKTMFHGIIPFIMIY